MNVSTISEAAPAISKSTWLTSVGIASTVLGCTIASPPAFAETIPIPSGRPILTVSGNIEHKNTEDSAVFDRDSLESIGISNLSTGTDWTDNVTEFEGVLGRDLLDYLGAEGETLFVTALNDYTVEIPISDFETYDVLLALTEDGVTLTPRDRGPIWIVYPRDNHPELNTAEMNDRWVWQVKAIEVKSSERILYK